VLKNKKLLIGGGGGLVFLLLFWFVLKPMFFGSSTPPVFTEEELAHAPRPTVTLEERVLNLKAPAAAPNYVKAVIALEFNDPDHAWVGLHGHSLAAKNEAFTEDFEPEMHRVWDIITGIFGSKTIEEVASGEGRDELKHQLVEAINHELHDQQVEDVFFVTFVTQ
jgi:flagellar basal body-associated protein FliL